MGPYEVFEGPGPAPACGAAYTSTPFYTGNDGLVAQPASCSCSCGTPTGVTCSSVTFSGYHDTSCSTTPCATVDLSPGACTLVDFNLCSFPDCVD